MQHLSLHDHPHTPPPPPTGFQTLSGVAAGYGSKDVTEFQTLSGVWKRRCAILYFQPLLDLFHLNFLVVQVFKIGLIIKPSNYFVAVQFGRFYRNTGKITAPWILHWVAAKPMMNGVVVYIKNYLPQIPLVFYDLPFKWPFKEGPMAANPFIERLRIRIKQL